MEFQKLIDTRKSTRHFTNTPLDKKLLQQIVQNAQKAPSWVNSQPWKVYIASGTSLATIKQIYLEKNKANTKGNPDFAILANELWPNYPRYNMENANKQIHGLAGFRQSQWQLFNAPCIAYLTIPKGVPEWSIHDLGMFSQLLLLSAQNQGVDSIIAYNLIKYPDVLREILHIPNDELIGIGIALGYAEKGHLLNNGNSERQSLDNILTFID